MNRYIQIFSCIHIKELTSHNLLLATCYLQKNNKIFKLWEELLPLTQFSAHHIHYRRDNIGDQGVDVRIILKWVSKE